MNMYVLMLGDKFISYRINSYTVGFTTTPKMFKTYKDAANFRWNMREQMLDAWDQLIPAPNADRDFDRATRTRIVEVKVK